MTKTEYGSKLIKTEQIGIAKELTPELSRKLFNQITQQLHDERVSKEKVLHHLKQLKAQMAKFKKEVINPDEKWAIAECMGMIDKKIAKVSGNNKK